MGLGQQCDTADVHANSLKLCLARDLDVPGVKAGTSEITPTMPLRAPSAEHRRAAGTSYIKC